MRTETIIKPKKGLALNLKEIWDYHELLYFLAWRDIKVRYRQTIFGVTWAILQPLVLMVVFSLFFGQILRVSAGSNVVPYPVFSYTGLLFWQFFAGTLSKSSGSFVASQQMLQKIYFPRIILVFSATCVNLIDFMMAAIVFIGLLFYFHFSLTLLGIALVIPAILISGLTAMGLGTFFATLNVRYRDVGIAMPFLIQLLLFLTPVIYPVSLVPESLRWILQLNPMTGVIDAMRASFLGLGNVNWESLGIALAVSILCFVVGYLYLKYEERSFADVI